MFIGKGQKKVYNFSASSLFDINLVVTDLPYRTCYQVSVWLSHSDRDAQKVVNSIRSIAHTSNSHHCTMEATVPLHMFWPFLNTGIFLERGKMKEDPGK